MCASAMCLSKFYTSDNIGFPVNRFTIDHTFLLLFAWKLSYPYFSNGFTNNHQFLFFSPYVNDVNRKRLNPDQAYYVYWNVYICFTEVCCMSLSLDELKTV